MKRGFLCVSILVFLILGCEENNFEKRIKNDYFFKKIDINGMQVFGKKHDTILKNGVFEILVNDYVFAIGSNENVIIIKQHHGGGIYSSWIDTTQTQFYIIDLAINKDSLYGPLKEYEFENTLLDLNGEMIDFDLVYPSSKE